jgi:GTP-binding protein
MLLGKESNVLLIGRSNVGKSSLFNRLTKSRDALVFDSPGVTRDIRIKKCTILDKVVRLIDTPGLKTSLDKMLKSNEPGLDKEMEKKVLDLMLSPNLSLFVIDGETGPTPEDSEISNEIRKSGNECIIVVNKIDKKKSRNSLSEAFELGFDRVIHVSSAHGTGINELIEQIHSMVQDLSNSKELSDLTIDEKSYGLHCTNCQCTDNTNICTLIEHTETSKNIVNSSTYNNASSETEIKQNIKIALVGRPNVGKSTLINMILGENRQLVADFSGLTRESAEFELEFLGQKLTIIDTPGVRRRSKVSDPLEKISASLSKGACRRAHVVIVIMDSTCIENSHVEDQDLSICSDVISMGKPVLVALNKCDQIQYKKKSISDFVSKSFKNSLSQLKNISFLFISAQNNINVRKMLNVAMSLHAKQFIKIKKVDINKWLEELNKSEVLSKPSTKFKLKYINQIRNNPPTFLVFTRRKRNMLGSHEKFIRNRLSESFGLTDVPIRVIFKESANEHE